MCLCSQASWLRVWHQYLEAIVEAGACTILYVPSNTPVCWERRFCSDALSSCLLRTPVPAPVFLHQFFANRVGLELSIVGMFEKFQSIELLYTWFFQVTF